jgi:hypothetical protein
VNFDLGRCISTYVEEWANSNDMQELFVRDADLIVESVDMVEACGAQMCNGQHETIDRSLLQQARRPGSLSGLWCRQTLQESRDKFPSASWSRFMKVRL